VCAPLVSDLPFSRIRVGGVTPAVRYRLIDLDLPAVLSHYHETNVDHTTVTGAGPLVSGVIGVPGSGMAEYLVPI